MALIERLHVGNTLSNYSCATDCLS
jgi:hypothetical protein